MENEYRISRPSVVAHLQSLGYEPIRVEKDSRSEGRLCWVFEYTKGLSGAAKTYTRHLLNRLAEADEAKEAEQDE